MYNVQVVRQYEKRGYTLEGRWIDPIMSSRTMGLIQEYSHDDVEFYPFTSSTSSSRYIQLCIIPVNPWGGYSFFFLLSLFFFRRESRLCSFELLRFTCPRVFFFHFQTLGRAQDEIFPATLMIQLRCYLFSLSLPLLFYMCFQKEKIGVNVRKGTVGNSSSSRFFFVLIRFEGVAWFYIYIKKIRIEWKHIVLRLEDESSFYHRGCPIGMQSHGLGLFEQLPKRIKSLSFFFFFYQLILFVSYTKAFCKFYFILYFFLCKKI